MTEHNNHGLDEAQSAAAGEPAHVLGTDGASGGNAGEHAGEPAGDHAGRAADAVSPGRSQMLIVEAVLFAMGTSVETRQLAQALGCNEKQAAEAARRLQKEYDDEGRAIQIIELEDCFQMCTRGEYYDALVKVVKTPRKQVMTDAVMETLSIIAYRQPVTRAEIEKIRGVSSDYAINKLIDFGLVYEAGRLDVPGRPAAFATTEEFLRRFGVASKKDLPTLDAGTEAQIIKEVAREIDFRPEGMEFPEDDEVEGQMDLADFLQETAAGECPEDDAQEAAEDDAQEAAGECTEDDAPEAGTADEPVL